MFGDFFKDKSILITGHTGFKGSWLALWLHELGAVVTGLALPPPTAPSHFELTRLPGLINHVEGDIRDYDIVRETFDKTKPEIVFHLAAQAVVRDSYQEPKTTFDTNVGGTVNILEVMRHCPSVKAAVFITSDKCYENKECECGYKEDDPLGGHDPYSASKGAMEIVCAAYRRSYFGTSGGGPHLGFATARAGNVIGGGDWAKDRIIPDCIRALSAEQPIVVRHPQAVRSWQHILDLLGGYLLLAKLLAQDGEKYAGAWNFGPLEEGQTPVIDLVEKVLASWGGGEVKIMPAPANAPHEANLLKLSVDKARRELNWWPFLDNSAAISWTVDWYKAWHLREVDLLGLSLRQIREFSKITGREGY